jgi:hypothetical protein
MPPAPARRSGHRRKRFSLACSSEEGDSPLCQGGVPDQTHRRALVAPIGLTTSDRCASSQHTGTYPRFRTPLCRTRDMRTHRELTLIPVISYPRKDPKFADYLDVELKARNIAAGSPAQCTLFKNMKAEEIGSVVMPCHVQIKLSSLYVLKVDVGEQQTLTG